MGSTFHLAPLMTAPESWKDPALAHLGCHSNMQAAWSHASPAEPEIPGAGPQESSLVTLSQTILCTGQDVAMRLLTWFLLRAKVKRCQG